MIDTPKKPQFTYPDYLTRRGEGKVELLEGDLVQRPPDSPAHARLRARIMEQLSDYLRGRYCKVRDAPFTVRLFDTEAVEEIHTVVEPDICIICDLHKLDAGGCSGPPDMILEILEPGTGKLNRFIKLNLYRRAGVQEYWLVDPQEKSIQVWVFRHAKEYAAAYHTGRELAKVHVLHKCYIDLAKVFG